MGSSEGSGSEAYVLKRDFLASARLTSQHWMLREREGWFVHPKIRKDFLDRTSPPPSRPLRIADVAAGNCIWSRHVLDEFPGAEVTALDLSPEAFPPPSLRSEQVTYELYNFFDPPPAKYENYFDIVHVRLILGILYKGGQDLVVQNLVSMLRPGGWLQWQDAFPPELAPIDMETLSPVPLSEMPACCTIMAQVTGIWETTEFIRDLDGFIRDRGGLEDTEGFVPPVKRELLQQETEVALWLYSEIARGVVARWGTDEQKRRMAESIDEEWDKIRQGRVWANFMIVAVGRKPVASHVSVE